MTAVEIEFDVRERLLTEGGVGSRAARALFDACQGLLKDAARKLDR